MNLLAAFTNDAEVNVETPYFYILATIDPQVNYQQIKITFS
jgi:hypothetical protein